jgi:hypothetical protein
MTFLLRLGVRVPARLDLSKSYLRSGEDTQPKSPITRILKTEMGRPAPIGLKGPAGKALNERGPGNSHFSTLQLLQLYKRSAFQRCRGAAAPLKRSGCGNRRLQHVPALQAEPPHRTAAAAEPELRHAAKPDEGR